LETSMPNELRPNPFNFRLPIRSAVDLVGRQVQLAWFVQALSRLGDREPDHLLVIGPGGFGKTSLLNGYSEEALKAGYLAIHHRWTDSLVSSGEAFFESMLTAGMLALEAIGELNDDLRFTNWIAQVGRAEPGPTHPTLISHAQPFTDPTTIIRDCRQISSLA